LLLILFRSINEDRVADCLIRLDHALGNFEVRFCSPSIIDRVGTNVGTQFSRHIDSSVVLRTLEKDINAYCQRIQKSVDAIGNDVAYIRQKFDDIYPSKPVPILSSSRCMPSKPHIFRGRDALVDDLAHRLIAVSADGKCVRISVLAAGGMGKLPWPSR
jgi:hypothetical protein